MKTRMCTAVIAILCLPIIMSFSPPSQYGVVKIGDQFTTYADAETKMKSVVADLTLRKLADIKMNYFYIYKVMYKDECKPKGNTGFIVVYWDPYSQTDDATYQNIAKEIKQTANNDGHEIAAFIDLLDQKTFQHDCTIGQWKIAKPPNYYICASDGSGN